MTALRRAVSEELMASHLFPICYQWKGEKAESSKYHQPLGPVGKEELNSHSLAVSRAESVKVVKGCSTIRAVSSKASLQTGLKDAPQCW